MSHLSEEELAEQYWGEPNRAVKRHLDACAECAGAYAALTRQLGSVREIEIPERDKGYGEQMWARVSAALPPAPSKHVSRFVLWRGLAYAAGCAVLIAGSFWVGRVWEHRHQLPSPMAKQAPSPAQPRVVVIVLSDHLERSERLLVELKHADADDSELVKPIQDEARRLLAANKVCVENAPKEDEDPRLMRALNELGNVLSRISSDKGHLSAADLEKLKDQVDAEGLLFQVRVLRSKAPGYAWTVDAKTAGGVA